MQHEQHVVKCCSPAQFTTHECGAQDNNVAIEAHSRFNHRTRTIMSTDQGTSQNSRADGDREPFNARALNASLTVKNLEASLAWYEHVLGFVVAQRHERGGKLVAASLKAGDASIVLGQDDGAKGWDRVKGEGISLQFVTSQSIDTLADRIKATGTSLHTEPVDTPWGARVFRVADPDGFKLVFSS